MSLIKVSLLALAALTPLLTHADVAPFWTPDPNGPKMTGPCQGNVTNAEFLGNVTSINTYSSRDVGYHGSIGNFQINIYGDTSQCPEGSQKDDCWNGADFVGSNTAAFDTGNPLQVMDFNTVGHKAQQFCPKMNISEEQDNVFFAVGLSNVVQTNNTTGITFTCVNNRTMGANGETVDNVLGSGIGVIDASGDFPVCTRHDQLWWNAPAEPMWGSNGAVDGRDGWIYVFGDLSGGSFTRQYLVYLAKVPADQATNLDAYQYWNGSAWSSDRLINPTPEQAVMQGVPPGQVFWNEYLFCWMAVIRDPLGMWTLSVSTATNLHGPWSAPQQVYQETDLSPQPIAIYAPAPHPQFDPTGQTLVVTYAAYGPISAVKLTFSK